MHLDGRVPKTLRIAHHHDAENCVTIDIALVRLVWRWLLRHLRQLQWHMGRQRWELRVRLQVETNRLLRQGGARRRRRQRGRGVERETLGWPGVEGCIGEGVSEAREEESGSGCETAASDEAGRGHAGATGRAPASPAARAHGD